MPKRNKASEPVLATSLTAIAAIVRAAEQARFDVDPVLPPALSRATSVISSVVKRHGTLIQSVLGETLIASGRYDVLTNLKLPVTEAGLRAAEAGELGPLPLSGEIVGTVDADLVVIDRSTGKAVAVQVKRGGGKTEGGKRRAIERSLRAAAVTLPDAIGCHGVARAGSAVIVDVFGRSAFDPTMTVSGPDLDDYFDVPVWGALGAATAALGTALRELIPVLLRPVLDEVEREHVRPVQRTVKPTSPFRRCPSSDSVATVLMLTAKRRGT
jgi:hypothetical protein